MINYTMMPVVQASEIEKAVEKKYDKQIYLAPTMWPGEFLNDCYKDLDFSDDAVADNEAGMKDFPDEEIYYNRKMIYEVVREAFSLELSLGQDTVLVDVSL